MGLMTTRKRTPAASPILGPRKKPPVRPDSATQRWAAGQGPMPGLGYVGSDPRGFGGGREAASARAPGPPKRYTDAELLATGRTGADLQAYSQRAANAAPGGAAAGAALMRQGIDRRAAASVGRVPPDAAGRALVGGAPTTPWQPDLMKQITATTNTARGIAPGAAGAINYSAPNLFTYPEGGHAPGASRGRFVGPGAIQPGKGGQAAPAGPDLQTQARQLGWRPGPMQRPATPQDVAGMGTALLKTQAEGQIASMAPEMVKAQQVFQQLNQIAEMYPDPADRQRIAQVVERLVTGQEIPPGWWEWIISVTGQAGIALYQRFFGGGTEGQ